MKHTNSILLIALGAVSLLFGTAYAPAQQAAGSITGTVTDPGGAAVPGATVTAREVDQGTTWSTKTDSDGLYDFPQIPAGNITVKVDAADLRHSRGRPSPWF